MNIFSNVASFERQQKSGGMIGFTKDVGKIAKTARLGQIACFLVGLFIFFDDYANVVPREISAQC